MKVLMICDTAREAQFVRDHSEGIAGALFDAFHWPNPMVEFEVAASLRKPTHQELMALLDAMGGPTPEQRDAFQDALLEEQATRDGRNGVWIP